jgi:hypothetical protein
VKTIFIVVAIIAMLTCVGCGHLGQGNEEFSQQSGGTVFRSADHSDIDNPAATPIPEKVPGEETKPGRK